MRFVLALLAVVALLSSPMTAAAAQVACSHDEPAAMASMDMSGMPGMDSADASKAGDPCCDHGGKSGMTKDCAQACATMCAVTAALPSPPASLVRMPARVALAPARAAPGYAFEPSGPERPPKSMV